MEKALQYEQIKKKLELSREKKGNVDNTYKEIFRYIMPDRDYYSGSNDPTSAGNNKEGQQTHQGIFSSVAINAGQAFVNRIQSSLTPIKADFIEFSTDNPKDKKVVAEIARVINLNKNKSNFDVEISSFYSDLIAGTACILIQPNTLQNPYNFTSIPIKDVSYLQGANSLITDVFRRFEMKNSDLPYQWKELENLKIDPKEADKQVKLIECTHYNYDTKLYEYYVVNEDKKEKIVERTMMYNPFIILRWFTIAGEIYGRGVGMQALPDIKTHNELKKYQLKNAQFSLPILLAEEDAMPDPDDFVLEPLAVNPVASTMSTNPSVTQLPISTNAEILKYNLDDLEMSIKRTMLDNILPDQVRPGISATEIVERVQAGQMNISSVFGRLEGELIKPLVKAMLYIAKDDFGLLDETLDIENLESNGVEIQINTPLMKQQRQEMVKNSVGALSVINSFDPTGRIAMSSIKTSEYANWLLTNLGMPTEFVYTPEEITNNLVSSAQAENDSANANADMDAERTMAIDENKARSANANR